MEASVLQVRGIDKAEFPMQGVVLLAGPNGAGKSSICTAVACALSGEPLPALRMNDKGRIGSMMTKAEGARLVRSGFKSGGVRIKTPTGEVQITWPSAEVKGTGLPPSISVYAAGLLSILDYDPKQQARALAGLVKAEPTDDEIRIAFTDVGMPAEYVQQSLDKLRMNGWEAMLDAAKQNGAKLKGAWEGFAESAYGSDKAERWAPQGWDPVYANVSDQIMAEGLANAKQALEDRMKQEGANEAQMTAWRVEAGKLPELAEERAQLDAAITAADAAYQESKRRAADAEIARQGAVADIPQRAAAATTGLECPHCKKPVKLDGGALVKAGAKKVVVAPEGPTDEQIAAATEAANQAAETARTFAMDAERLRAAVVSLEQRLPDLTYRLKLARDAETALTDAAQTPDNLRPVQDFRDAIAIAEGRIQAKRRKEGADEAHQRIKTNQGYIHLLAPEGLRKRKLLRSLDDFNGKLAELCNAAKYRVVTIGEEMQVLYGGRNYYLLSGSEQYRVRAIMQIIFAQADSNSVVILDGADILDNEGRNGLFSLLGRLDMIALVGMTIDKLDKVPDLARAGMGRSYWVEGGGIQAIGQ